jgi:hypothetical protein
VTRSLITGRSAALAASDAVRPDGGFGVYTFSGPNFVVFDRARNARTVRGASTFSDQVGFTIVIP